MPAVVIAGALAAGGAVAGAAISAHATHQAAQAAQTAASENNALQRDIYGQNTANETGFLQSGQHANNYIDALLTGNEAEQNAAFARFRASTGYQFQVDQGTKAVNASAAARGDLHSGATLKALQDRGQQTAASYFDRYLGALQTQQGVGLSAANALNGVGTNFANATSANNTAAADATGNAALAGAANTNTLLGSLAQTGGYLAGQGAFGGSGSSYKLPTTVPPVLTHEAAAGGF